ncbi:MAG: hypothetical protein HDT39_06640 [Lachnospiraceae bacterium]|nr:hypothetical protein [Lachnospiraceae bacterium]
MSVTINNPQLSSISKDMYLRMDVDYFLIQQKYDLTHMKKMREYITFLESGKSIKAEDYEIGTDNIHITVRNIDDSSLNLENAIYINDDKADELSKYRLQVGDIVITISSNCGNSFVYDEELPFNMTLSHYLCRIRIKNDLLLEKYLILFMQSSLCKDYFRSVETGKTIKNLAQRYIYDMPIYVPTAKEQLEIINKATPILFDISNLKLAKKSISSIVDKTFEEYFKYNYAKFDSLKEKMFYSSFLQCGNNVDARFSAKFQRPTGEFVYHELLNRPNKKIKHCLVLPMITGQGIETTDYDESGNYAYVSMADISSWELDLTDIKYVSNDYAIRKLTKKIKGLKTPVSTEISVNDIVMMRSGEGGIGKVAIIKDDVKGIFCDFIIRMRFDESVINPEFAYFYFRSQYFQYLIEINKKGLGNNTNIFPNQVQEFPIPDIPLSEQQKIVNMINTEIYKQKEIEKQIDEKKNEIEKMIDKILK